MRKIHHVVQSGKMDCGAACIAMVLGLATAGEGEALLQRRIGELTDPITAHQVGTFLAEITAVLYDRNIRHLVLYWPTGDGPYARLAEYLKAIDCRRRFVNHFKKQKLSIIAVNIGPTGSHWVVAVGDQILDPGKHQAHRLTRISDIQDHQIAAIILIDEMVRLES